MEQRIILVAYDFLCSKDANVFVRYYCKIIRKDWIGKEINQLALFIHPSKEKMSVYDMECVIERYIKEASIKVEMNSYVIRQVYNHQLLVRCENRYQSIYLV